MLIQADKHQLKKAFDYIFEYCLSDSKSDTTLICDIKNNNKMLNTKINFENKYSAGNLPKNNYQKLLPNQMDKVGRSLGLYLAQKIISSHNGNFICENKNSKTCCIINLPLSNINIMPEQKI